MQDLNKKDRLTIVLELGCAINWKQWARDRFDAHNDAGYTSDDEVADGETMRDLAEEANEFRRAANRAEKILTFVYGKDFHESVRRFLDNGAVNGDGFWADGEAAEQTKKAIAIADWNDGMMPRCGHLAGDPDCDGCY